MTTELESDIESLIQKQTYDVTEEDIYGYRLSGAHRMMEKTKKISGKHHPKSLRASRFFLDSRFISFEFSMKEGG